MTMRTNWDKLRTLDDLVAAMHEEIGAIEARAEAAARLAGDSEGLQQVLDDIRKGAYDVEWGVRTMRAAFREEQIGARVFPGAPDAATGKVQP
jgi:hypothetical protein